jgi:hypothetical protein
LHIVLSALQAGGLQFCQSEIATALLTDEVFCLLMHCTQQNLQPLLLANTLRYAFCDIITQKCFILSTFLFCVQSVFSHVHADAIETARSNGNYFQ